MRRIWRTRGSAAIEMAVLMPLFVALFTAAVVLGRTGTALSAVEMAAYDGARTASLARDADTARSEATAAVERSLADRGLACVDGPDVELPGLAAAFGQPVGVRASVTVRVTCQVTYGDVDLVGVPDDRELSARFVSPLDQYRARR